jgi:two-component system sensor histidine kinase/response regulator
MAAGEMRNVEPPPVTWLATPEDRRNAFVVVALSLLGFIVMGRFAKVPLPRSVGFVALYEAALLINDLITAVLLLGMYRVFRFRALLALACGYLFTAGMATIHALTFPGLFSEAGLLGAGPQSTAWLYMFWHAGFPVMVLAYAVLKDELPAPVSSERVTTPLAILTVTIIVCTLGYVATAMETSLPVIMAGDGYTERMSGIVSAVWAFSIAALAFLWIRTPHSVLDVWLMVVMCAWLFDIALAALLNQGRFDFGFYAGRVYGLVAATSVLIVLILEYSKLHQRLIDAHAEAQAASRGKDVFLAMVAHELRNPVAALNNVVEAIQRIPSEDRRLCQTRKIAQRQTAHLARLVEDLVDAGRIATGRLQLRTQLLDLAQVTTAVVDTHKHTGRLGEHAVNVHKACVYVNADPQRMEQVISNLLGNAVKYTPPGGAIEISVGPDGDEAILRVRDEGIGISPEVAQRAFDWFYQGIDSTDSARGGLGIGLAVVRTIVELHGGAIEVQSDRSSEGSLFTVRLPRVHADDHAAVGARTVA